MKNLNKTALALALAALAGSAMADAPAAAAPAGPSLGTVIASTPGLAITGYVAATYDYFNQSTPAMRQFDTTQNGFTVNQAALSVAYLPASGAGAQVVAMSGTDATALRSSETYPNGSSTTQFDLFNAFAQYNVGTFTLMGGKFSTLAGAEVAPANGNNEISRSMLFTYMEPITHTGVRVVDTISPALVLTGGVNNGWNYTTVPTASSGASGKTIELGASGTVSPAFSYSLAYYNGDSPLFQGTTTTAITTNPLQLFDAVLTYNATSALALIANVDYLTKDNVGLLSGGTGSAKADGIALYANYTISDQWMLSLRGEYVNDSNGILTEANALSGTNFGAATSNTLKEGTVALNYTVSKNMKLSGEIRHDTSNVGAFYNGASSQTSYELQALYSF